MADLNTNLPPSLSSPEVNRAVITRLSPMRAGVHSAGLILFGLFGLFVAVRYVVGDAVSLVFILATGSVVSIAALGRVMKRAKASGSSNTIDGGLYPGLLVGGIVGASLLIAGQPAEWILSGLLICVAVFSVVMARFENSAVGLSVAVSLATLAAFVGVAQFSTWVLGTLLAMSVMLVAAGFAVSGERSART